MARRARGNLTEWRATGTLAADCVPDYAERFDERQEDTFERDVGVGLVRDECSVQCGEGEPCELVGERVTGAIAEGAPELIPDQVERLIAYVVDDGVNPVVAGGRRLGGKTISSRRNCAWR